VWEHGRKDPTTGAVTALPIEDSIEKFLEKSAKAKSGPEAEHAATASKMYYSDASSGRRASDKRR
jgi:hypothetical protein